MPVSVPICRQPENPLVLLLGQSRTAANMRSRKLHLPRNNHSLLRAASAPISMSMSGFALQSNYKVFACEPRQSPMKTPKTDRLLRAAMGLLMVVLVYVTHPATHERVVVAWDDAPAFSVRTE